MNAKEGSFDSNRLQGVGRSLPAKETPSLRHRLQSGLSFYSLLLGSSHSNIEGSVVVRYDSFACASPKVFSFEAGRISTNQEMMATNSNFPFRSSTK